MDGNKLSETKNNAAVCLYPHTDSRCLIAFMINVSAAHLSAGLKRYSRLDSA